MGDSFEKIINVNVLQEMAIRLYRATGIPVGIIGVNGTIYVQAGWQEICMKYHRAHAESCKRCIESDRYIESHLGQSDYVEYQCLNHLWDVALPIIISNQHLATLFVGQFFYDDQEIEIDVFKKQAQEYGFDERDYLDSVQKVPIFSREKIRDIMSYYKCYTEFLVEDGLKQLENDRIMNLLRNSEVYYKNTFDRAPIGICTQKVNGPFLTVNKEFCQLMGYTEKELMTMNFKDLTYFEDLDVSRLHMEKLLVGKIHMFEINKRYITKSGRIFDALVNVSMIKEGLENDPYLLAIVRDMTKTKKAEKAIQQYKDIAENMQIGLFVYRLEDEKDDSSLRLIKANPAASTIFGFDMRNCIGKKIDTNFPELRKYGISEKFAQVVRTGRSITSEAFYYADSRIHESYFSYKAIPLPNNCLCVLFEDISEREKIKEEIQRARDEAEYANQAKSQFLSNMSHEIRTPLNAIYGVNQLLAMTHLDQEQMELLKLSSNATNGLLDVINNILDFSKIEAGSFDLHMEEMNIKDVVTSTINLFSIQALGKGIDLVCEWQGDFEGRWVGDGVRLKQILINLIGNALKFTENGSIKVGIEILPSPNSENTTILFNVIDTGIGIAESDLDRLFHRFSQLNNSLTKEHSGSGLGLAICKGLIEKMHGEIWVRSTLGEGSTFSFTCVLEHKNQGPH